MLTLHVANPLLPEFARRHADAIQRIRRQATEEHVHDMLDFGVYDLALDSTRSPREDEIERVRNATDELLVGYVVIDRAAFSPERHVAAGLDEVAAWNHRHRDCEIHTDSEQRLVIAVVV